MTSISESEKKNRHQKCQLLKQIVGGREKNPDG